MWGKKQANVLAELFIELDNKNIKWMIFRNYEGLPDMNNSKDVDLIIEKEKIKDAEVILKEIMKKNDFTRYDHDRFECIWCYTFFNISEKEVSSIKIDFFYGLVWRGSETISFDYLYENSINYNNFRVPEPTLDAVLLFLKPLMTGGVIKEKYLPTIKNEVEKNPSKFKKHLNYILDTKIANKVWKELEENKIYNTINFKSQICRSTWFKRFKNNPLLTLTSFIEHSIREFKRRIIRKKGNFVCFLGPDGVGKSTIIDLISLEAEKKFIKEKRDVEIIHFRPYLFPNIGALAEQAKIKKQDKNFHNPHRGKEKNFISSLLRITYYWLDYFLGYYCLIKNKLKNNRVVIFDRYFYDFLADPKRSSIKLPYLIKKIYLRFVPKPDIVFFLHCEADIIYERKQELTMNSIEILLKKYEKLKKDDKRINKIDASLSPKEITFEVLRKWVEKTTTKIR